MLPALTTLTLRVRTYPPVGEWYDPIVSVVRVLDGLQAPALQVLNVVCWFDHLGVNELLWPDWVLLNGTVRRMQEHSSSSPPFRAYLRLVHCTQDRYRNFDDLPPQSTSRTNFDKEAFSRIVSSFIV